MPKSEIGEIWRWSFPAPNCPSEFKVWIDPKYQDIKRQIAGWQDTKIGATYFYPNKAVTCDYIIPAKYYNRTAKLLSLPPRKKNPNRVVAGMTAGSRFKSNLTKVVARKSLVGAMQQE